MKFRDAWNVWRRKVDKALEDATGEISGKDVTFEGTGISATNVEDAINEVNGAVGTLSGDVTGLITTVGDSDSGLVKDVSALSATVGDSDSGLVKDVNDLKTMPLVKTGKVTYTATAGTTVASAIGALFDKFVDDVTSQLADGMYAMPYRFIVPYSANATVSFDTYGHFFDNATTKSANYNVNATRAIISESAVRVVAGVIGGSLSNAAHIYDYNSVSGNTVVHDAQQLSADTTIYVIYCLFKGV